jgi:hypothetical protein
VSLDLTHSAAMADQLRRLEARRDALRAELVRTSKHRQLDDLSERVPDALRRCADEVGRMADLADERVVRRAQVSLRALLGDGIKLVPDRAGRFLIAHIEVEKRAVPLIADSRVTTSRFESSRSAL